MTMAAAAEAAKELGNAAYKATRFQEAVEHYTRAIEQKPDEATYWTNRAAALMALGRLDEALADCEHARTADPACTKAYLRMASVL
jgi:DnaJ family protein C protein 7